MLFYLLQLIYPSLQTSRGWVPGVAVGSLPAPSRLLLRSHRAAAPTQGEDKQGENGDKRALKKTLMRIFQILPPTNCGEAESEPGYWA